MLGAHNPRIAFARELLTKKGRQEHGRFLAEGPTLLAEAVEGGTDIEAVFVTEELRNTLSIVRELEARSIPVHLINDATAAKLSDVETPTGIIAVCVARTVRVEEFFSADGLVLILADLADPGNAGTLLRSADAFGVSRVLFGSHGVEPFNPKVVRSSMGSLFRATIAVASPAEVVAATNGWVFAGLTRDGEPLRRWKAPNRAALVIGQERRGLGAWTALCREHLGIPMRGRAESLNAGVAGSIALYEVTRPPA
ncbi:MAG: RNA methyltransferase [Candidatus Eremiobacteraeota bacterium]|nr:RNA methyltransferase [Candidatus Eremiobacteraeota bacterium]